jgi:SAM-dependent methyltransferase
VAPNWEERREWMLGATRPVNDWLVKQADPQPGQTFLELAAGTGDLGFEIAERVGSEGHLITSDFSPEMLDVARRNGEARGVAGVEYRVLDAEQMDLADDSVDAIVCRFGYMLMADPGAAFAQTRRVLRDGGRLAFAVWMGPDRNPWAALPGTALVQRGHMPRPEPGAPGIFSLGDPARIRELVTGAGFGEPELEEIAFAYRYADADDLWSALIGLAGGIGRTVGALSDDERAAAREAVIDSVAEFRDEDGSYTAPATACGVLAR